MPTNNFLLVYFDLCLFEVALLETSAWVQTKSRSANSTWPALEAGDQGVQYVDQILPTVTQTTAEKKKEFESQEN